MIFRQFIKREFRQFLSADRKTRVTFLFGAGMAYLFLFGILYEPGVVKHIPVAVYDEDQSNLSRALVRDFEDNESFSVIEEAASQNDMQRLLREKTVYAAVNIPKDFSKNIRTGSSATVLFMINGANIIITNIASNGALDILTSFSNKIAVQQSAMMLGASETLLQKEIEPISYNFRILNNPTQSYLLFFVIGLAMAAFQQGVFLSVGSAVQYEYHNGSDTNFSKADIGKLVAAKLIVYWLLSMISFMIIILSAEYIWGIWSKSAILKTALLSGSFFFAAIAFCLMAASLFSTLVQFVRASIMYTVPAFVLAGYTFPREAMPELARVISTAFPLTWFAGPLRQMILAGMSADMGNEISVLLGMGIMFFIAAEIIFSKKMINRISVH